jgi:hypothetical protein
MTAFASPRASAHVRVFFQTPLDWLVLAVPAAFAIRFVPAWNNASLLFVVAGVGIIPLAGWLGRATEQIAAHTGAGIGGFLNATFGNAAELIIALMALSKGLTTVVKASLTGFDHWQSVARARRVGIRWRPALFTPEVQQDRRARLGHGD